MNDIIMNDIILTQEALDKLKHELEDRKARRPEITERIATARAHGDLSENFDYHDAKDEQGMNESRIKELQHMIKSAQVVQKVASGKVGLGSQVVVEFNGKEMNFEIVSFNMADPGSGKISDESPIGAALLGYSAGDIVEVTTPTGAQMKYKIISVS